MKRILIIAMLSAIYYNCLAQYKIDSKCIESKILLYHMKNIKYDYKKLYFKGKTETMVSGSFDMDSLIKEKLFKLSKYEDSILLNQQLLLSKELNTKNQFISEKEKHIEYPNTLTINFSGEKIPQIEVMSSKIFGNGSLTIITLNENNNSGFQYYYYYNLENKKITLLRENKIIFVKI